MLNVLDDKPIYKIQQSIKSKHIFIVYDATNVFQ